VAPTDGNSDFSGGIVSATLLLDRLDGVRQTGAGRWLARCPAHEDRRASLSIRELDDGRILLHDFAGCAAHEVVGALGLNLSDLFPASRPSGPYSLAGVRRPFPASDVLRALDLEATVVVIAAGRLAKGYALTPEDRERLTLAASRIGAAVAESGHG
jgi:hypothetical protein